MIFIKDKIMLYLSIPKPCTENWNAMTQVQQGKFCQSCSTTVIDFTQMTDDEILHYFETYKDQKTCGRFMDTQLNRKIEYATKLEKHYHYVHQTWQNTWLKRTYIAVLAAVLFVQSCTSSGSHALGNIAPIEQVVNADTMNMPSASTSMDTLKNRDTLNQTKISLEQERRAKKNEIVEPKKSKKSKPEKPKTFEIINLDLDKIERGKTAGMFSPYNPNDFDSPLKRHLDSQNKK
jgi:hypothetical protein